MATEKKFRLPRDKDGKFVPPSWLVSVVWIIGFFILWNIIALLFDIAGSSETKFPYLHDIVKWAFSPEYDGNGIFRATFITLSVFAKGCAIGLVIGFIVAILMSLFVQVEKISYPLLLLSQMIPMLGLAPIIVSLVGDFETAKVVMSAYMTFFPVAANMFAGLKEVDKERQELLKISATNKFKVYIKLMIPGSVPSLFVGIKVAAPAAFAAVIFTEVLYPQNGGIGAEILNSQYGNDWDLCWGYILISVIVSVAIFYIISFIEKLLVYSKGSNR